MPYRVRVRHPRKLASAIRAFVFQASGQRGEAFG